MQGDLSSIAGQVKVTVVGIQTTPVSSTPPNDGQGLIALSGVYTPVAINNAIMVNSVPVSDDFDIGVNLNTVRPGILVNGA